ncbi:MAG TPA: ABC transporter substrate-binding protein [Xanthobacteraceae bacterium]|nr:ABC transporter substrate-binding protein [Xanthobacteraceae bacterium]
MPNVHVTIATWDYDHVRDLRMGEIRPVGIDVTWLDLNMHEIFARFLANREWDVSELSFAKYIAEASGPDPDLVALPVFLRREFRYGIIYVNRHRIRTPEDLRGKRIGIPEWAQTATVYIRGALQHDFGVPFTEIEWMQAGVNEKGRAEKVEMDLPKGVRLTVVAGKSLSDMLAAGEIDAAMCATAPDCFGKHPDIVRLWPDFTAMGEAFYARTRVYPIMHVAVMRKAILKDNPWIARNLYNAFDQSRRQSLARLRRPGYIALPGHGEQAEAAIKSFGGDYFPYGIEENRAALELFLRYAHEQGIARRPMTPEEIFPPGIMVKAAV